MLSTNLLATLRASLLASLAVKHCGHVRTKLQRANYAECTNAFLARANLSRSRISNHLIPHLDCEAAERSAKTEETHCTCALSVYGRPTSHTSDTHLILGSTCWNAFLKPSCSAYGGCLKFHVPGNAIFAASIAELSRGTKVALIPQFRFSTRKPYAKHM